MKETDVIPLAAFLVSYENLMVNKEILKNNMERHKDNLIIAERQGELLERVIRLLEAVNEGTV